MFGKNRKQVNVLKLAGVISSQGRKSLSFSSVKNVLDKAFKGSPKAVALLINSPGGSPVQSEMIANYITQLSITNKIPVVTFIEDVAASGGYWLAVVGNEVYALSKSSIVGSIGVLYTGFGLQNLIAKYDIERRVHTAGKNKVTHDMFQAEKPEDITKLKNILADIHEHFKDWILSRRKDKLTITEDELFTGEFWTANQGLKYGLIDGIANLEPKIKELYGKKVKINYINLVPKKSLFNIFNMKFPQNIVDDVTDKLKSEALWNKYGL